MTHQKPTHAELENRFKHHPPHGDQVERYRMVRESLLVAASTCVTLTPCSPEQTRAVSKLEEAMMLFNAAIARHESPPCPEPRPE